MDINEMRREANGIIAAGLGDMIGSGAISFAQEFLRMYPHDDDDEPITPEWLKEIGLSYFDDNWWLDSCTALFKAGDAPFCIVTHPTKHHYWFETRGQLRDLFIALDIDLEQLREDEASEI